MRMEESEAYCRPYGGAYDSSARMELCSPCSCSVAGVELLIEGPVIVGIPILADTRMAEGALALGIISSAYAGGSLMGAILAGTLPAPKRGLGPTFVILIALTGVLAMPFGFLSAMWAAAALALAIGVMGGYVDILFTSWLQGRTPRAMMGRVMSLLMVAAVGLSPISVAASGALIKQSLEWVFVGAGSSMAIFCVAVGLRREVREMRMAENLNHEPEASSSHTDSS